MANYQALKTAIQQVIKTNGNKEITGALLQQSLLSMINSLGAGYQFMGVATPTTNPGDPDAKVFYIAAEPGVYANFGGVQLANSEIGIFKYDSVWVTTVLNLISIVPGLTQRYVNIGNNVNIPSIGAILPFYSFEQTFNVYEGYIFYVPLVKGKRYIVTNGTTASMSINAYKALPRTSENIVQSFDDISGGATAEIYITEENAKYIGGYANASGSITIRSGVDIAETIKSLSLLKRRTETIHYTGTVGYATILKSLNLIKGHKYNVVINALDYAADFTFTVRNGQDEIIYQPNSGYKFYRKIVKLSFYVKEDYTDAYIRCYGGGASGDIIISIEDDINSNIEYLSGFGVSKKQTLTTAGSVYASVSLHTGHQYIFKNRGSQCTLNLVKDDGTEINISSGVASSSEIKFVADDNYVGIRCYCGLNVDFSIYPIEAGGIIGDVQEMVKPVCDFNQTIQEAGSVSINVQLIRGHRYYFTNRGAQCTLNIGKDDGNVEINISDGISPGATISFVCDDNYTKIRCYSGGPTVSFIVVSELEFNNQFQLFKDDLLKNSFFIQYNAIDDSAVINRFCQLFNTQSIVESFVFFTDPHLYYSAISEQKRQDSINRISKIWRRTPTDFVLCGGDWLDGSDKTKAVARTDLGTIDAITRTAFDQKYFGVFGNHDDNYQGRATEESETYTGALTRQEIINLWYRKYGHKYYSFLGSNSRIYVFDSESDSLEDSQMSDYKWEQLDWFAEELISHNDAHNIISVHIIYRTTDQITDFATNIAKLANAYNERDSITIDGHSYNFESATGMVHCIIGGHTHADSNFTLESIPVIITANLLENYIGEIGFDIIMIDYDSQKLHAIRVGRGNDRTIDIL